MTLIYQYRNNCEMYIQISTSRSVRIIEFINIKGQTMVLQHQETDQTRARSPRTKVCTYSYHYFAVVVLISLSLLCPCTQAMPPKQGIEMVMPPRQSTEEGQLEPPSLAITAEEAKEYLKGPEQVSFPVDVHDFREMVTKTNLFVDKTMFIKFFFDKCPRFMIMQPQGWGKTLSMSMLYYFFKIVVDENGVPLNPQPHRVLFEGGETTIKVGDQEQRITLKPLKIAQACTQRQNFMDYQGQSPVIYTCWKNIKPTNSKDFLIQLARQFGEVFRRFKYIHNWLNEQHKDKSHRNYDGRTFQRYLNEDDWKMQQYTNTMKERAAFMCLNSI